MVKNILTFITPAYIVRRMTTRHHGDPKAEREFLTIVLNNPHLLADASEMVSPKHFVGPKSRAIYESALAVYNAGQSLDLSTLAAEMQANGEMKKLGGRSEIAPFFGAYVNEAFLTSLSVRIRSNAALRDIGAIAAEVLSECSTMRPDEQSIATMVDDIQGRLSDAVSHGRADDAGEARDEVPRVAERLMQPSSGKLSGVPTGFIDLDDVLHGFRQGQLILLAARSRVGKTSMACDLVRQVANEGYTVLFFSLEMTRDEIWERMVCGHARVSLHALRSRQADDEEKNRIKLASSDLTKCSIYVRDTPNMTPNSMRGYARMIQHKKGLGLIVVDYLQCIQSGKDKQTRYEVVSEVSRQLKVMARTLNVPVVALAQLNRQAEDEAPRLSQLRESGSLEQDADVVLLLNRPHVFDDSKDPSLATLDIAKHRNGPCRMVNLDFDADTVSFRNRLPKVEDFTKVSQESPVAPPRRKKNNWYDNGQYD